MYVSNIKLWDFRKFGSDREFNIEKPNLNLNFTQGLNVIVGENDSGKTAIIDAVKLVLKTHSYDYIRAENKDFFNSKDRFRIELIFEGLTPNEAKNFTEWLSWKSIYENGVEAIIPFLKINYDVKRQGEKILPTDVKAGSDVDGYLLKAEAKEYLKATYLKPLRDAENELVAKRNSRLSQILLGDAAFKGKEKDHELVHVFENLSKELQKYFRAELEIRTKNEDGVELVNKPIEGKRIKDKIDGYIKEFYGSNYEIEFNASSNDLKSILEKLTLSLKNESNPGLGTLNRLFMATELLHLNKSNWSGLRLGLVEELEAHLHPQVQMQVIEAFQKQDNIQLILTTHSPNLTSKIKLENLIICNNGNAFPMGTNYTKLDTVNYMFLEKFLDVTKSNLFFAKGIILVEGWAEEILIPSIAKAIGINLTEKGVSIVNIGHTGFDHYINIYLRKEGPHMTIPVAVITDSDVKEYVKRRGRFCKRSTESIKIENDEKIAKINSRSVENIVFFPAPNWTLEYSILKSTALKTVFKLALEAVHTRTPWKKNYEKLLAAKLIKKGLKKTEIAYNISNSIDEDLKKDENERCISIDLHDEKDTINYLLKAIEYAAGH